MSSLFEGNLAQRRHLLQQWLSSGEVADAAESNLSVAKSNERELKGQEKLLTVEGMRRHGVSEHLWFEIGRCIFEAVFSTRVCCMLGECCTFWF